MSSQDVVDFVNNAKSSNTSLQEITQKLTEHAIALGSSDNVTAILVNFE
jgi:serine/threonine protein phosphatase PrpC